MTFIVGYQNKVFIHYQTKSLQTHLNFLLEGVFNCTEHKLVSEFQQQKDDESRNRLRDALRKWHPDKFGQLTQGRIPDEEKKKICQVVTHISQVLINYGK